MGTRYARPNRSRLERRHYLKKLEEYGIVLASKASLLTSTSPDLYRLPWDLGAFIACPTVQADQCGYRQKLAMLIREINDRQQVREDKSAFEIVDGWE
jgi:hypothetical protein